MGYASIMVSIDLGAGAADRVQLAGSLARRFNACLIGVAARQVIGPLVINDIRAAEELEVIELERACAEIARARALFEANAGTSVKTAWHSAIVEPTAFLLDQCRAADLVVIGRQGPADGDPGPLAVSSGAVLMGAGRPVLIAPPGIERLANGRIVVAWKDAPEARRAVFDALPLLIRADEVFVVSVAPEVRRESVQDVAEYLARHAVPVVTRELEVFDLGPSDEILRFAAREDASLIVLGAYGHTRLHEWAFGGVTRDLLRTTPVCCLMSH